MTQRDPGLGAEPGYPLSSPEATMMANEMVVRTKQQLSRGGAYCKEFNRVRIREDMDWRVELATALEIVKGSKKLQNCTPESIGQSLIDLAQMGLTLSPAYKLAYLIPYGETCTASPSYMGLEQVAYRTGLIAGIQANVVRKGDTFRDWTDETGRHIHHEMGRERGEVTHAYCMAYLTNGAPALIEVMDQKALRACRDAAAKKNHGTVPFVWKGPFREEMYKKCAVRRASKHWPKSESPHIRHMMEALDRTDPMDFSTPVNELHKEFLGESEMDGLLAVLDRAGFPEEGQRRQLHGLARSLGYQSINQVPITEYQRAKEALKEGLDRWHASMTSADSGSAQADATSRQAEAS